jgi:hypothetical protein
MALIDINGVSLEIERISGTGPSGRAPIVFLHEGLGCVAQWTTREGDWPLALSIPVVAMADPTPSSTCVAPTA